MEKVRRVHASDMFNVEGVLYADQAQAEERQLSERVCAFCGGTDLDVVWMPLYATQSGWLSLGYVSARITCRSCDI